MKRVFLKILRFSGVVFLFREIIQRNRISILMFHDISESVADENFKYLKKHYNIIDLNDFLRAVKNGNRSILPKKAIILTFDDGHKGNYELMEVLNRYEIPITIFLCSEIIDTNRMYWFKYNRPNLKVESLKKVSNKERLRLLKEQGFTNETSFNNTQALSKDQIMEMKKFVNFQSHTKFHPCLSMCTKEEIFEELKDSKDKLSEEYGFDINSIAYPNGDYNQDTLQIAKELGYDLGLTCDFGFNNFNSNLLHLKRLSTNDTTNIDEFVLRACGLYQYITSLRK